MGPALAARERRGPHRLAPGQRRRLRGIIAASPSGRTYAARSSSGLTRCAGWFLTPCGSAASTPTRSRPSIRPSAGIGTDETLPETASQRAQRGRVPRFEAVQVLRDYLPQKTARNRSCGRISHPQDPKSAVRTGSTSAAHETSQPRGRVRYALGGRIGRRTA